MKIISLTGGGFLVDMKHDELAHILDKSRVYDILTLVPGVTQFNREVGGLVGKTVNLADIWLRLRDHVRLESALAAIRKDMSAMVAKCDQIEPIAREVTATTKPKGD